MSRLRLALAQINPVVGDLEANTAKVVQLLGQAESYGADIAVFPELAVTGYPPEDLLLKPGFVADNRRALERIAKAATGLVAVVGFVDEQTDLYNAAAVCAGGGVRGVYHKQVLPNYGVFDEQRYFASGSGADQLFGVCGVRVGVSICEDAWTPSGPISAQAAAGAELMININASPYSVGRVADRERMLATRAADSSCALVYVNCVGGQDELVFDGASMVFDERGDLVASLPQFEEALSILDLNVRPVFRKRLIDPRGRTITNPLPVVPVWQTTRSRNSMSSKGQTYPGTVAVSLGAHLHERLARLEEMYQALVLGTRDYVRKNGFTDVVIGLSGGIDSSLVAMVAVDAVGADHVHGVAMPSRYSSQGSVDDARSLATNLGIDLRVIGIEEPHQAFLDLLAGTLSAEQPGLAEENLQSRIRGLVLMALSNKLGWLVLTTGNKSEAAVGYSTLYGDTAGGFAVIKDVAKTTVYRLCAWRDSSGPHPLLPPDVMTKPPSAELRPDQRDDQSLPAYDLLDPLLEAYVEEDMTALDLVEAGFDEAVVSKVVRMVDVAEYKRRQTPPGIRITAKAFGRDRRVPITNGYR
ncbi:MAG: NAD+ synthase [Acidimicrobiales bacterium]